MAAPYGGVRTEPSEPADVRLPVSERSPLSVLLRRLGIAAGLVLAVSVVTYLDRHGFRDAAGDEIGVLDAFYDSAVLITLTVRELNPRARIVASVRETENAHLLEQGGADSVVVSSGAAGLLLGHAVKSPRVVRVLEDLLSVGEGLDVTEREVTPEELGRPLGSVPASAPILAVVRGEEVLRFDDPRVGELRAGDRVVCLCTNPG